MTIHISKSKARLNRIYNRAFDFSDPLRDRARRPFVATVYQDGLDCQAFRY